MKLKSVLKGTFMGIALFVVHALISAGAFLWHYTLSAGRFDGHAGGVCQGSCRVELQIS